MLLSLELLPVGALCSVHPSGNEAASWGAAGLYVDLSMSAQTTTLCPATQSYVKAGKENACSSGVGGFAASSSYQKSWLEDA